MRRVIGRIKMVLSAVLVTGALGASPALAQSQGAEGFGVQLIGGPLFANLTDTGNLQTDNKTGFLVGIGMGGNRGGRVGVEGDILYGRKGAKITGIGDFAHHVVHVPVMLKVNIGSDDASGLSFFGVGGAFFDWQFSGKLNDVDISENTDGFEVGYVLGGGVEFVRVSAQVRYIRGLRTIDRTFNVGTSSESKSQSIALLLALRLN